MVTAASHLASPETGLLEIERESKLRIGIVTHYMPPHMGGIELLAGALFDKYLEAGLQVRWVASRAPMTSPPCEEGRVRVGCWNGLESHLGVPWPIWGLAGVRELVRLIRWADVLHVHDCLYLGSALTVLLARRAQKPVILSQHIGFVNYASAILNWLERLAYQTLGRIVLRGASHLAFCTPAAEEFVTALLGGRPISASTIPNGIDTARFRPPTPAERVDARRKLKLAESSRVVLFVGRLVEKKGVDVLIKVCQQMPSYHFLLVGDGPLRASLPVGAQNLTWLPAVAPEQMEMVYHAADTFLLPSHGEGFPVTVHEAMAVGVPAIVPKGEAYTAVLEHEEACLSAERTPASLCESLDRLWDTPELAAALAARSRELVMREWSLDTMGARYLSLIRNLVEQN